jgi:cytochrome c-type biogenesis protein CcmH/NrfG
VVIQLRVRQLALALISAVLVATPTFAVDVPNRNSPPEHRSMREARALIAEKRWAHAERILAAHVKAEPQDADAHNLLGFSLRNLGRLNESLVAYRRALELDPAHLGAHEYIGEAYVQLGDLARSRAHLEALVRLCPAGCSELDDLRGSLAAAGSRPAGVAPAARAASRPR